MEFFRIKRDIPFMRHALVFNIISVVTFVLAVFFLATKGLNFSIEFTGGTVIEVGYQQPADVEKISGVISQRNLQRLSNASWLASRGLGSGTVILFADDPLFRHFWYGTFQPFVNALLLGPSM